MTDDRFKTYGDVFDNYTHRNIFKLVSQGIFEELESPISIGKEANIFSAKMKDGSRVIVKIYRLETCDFNKMYDYIRTDPRFPNIRSSKRKIIFEWTRREYTNLMKAREMGVRVPQPIALRDNLVVMELIGDGAVAPKIKDTSDVDIEKFAEKTVEYMRILYQNNLVHGDLSEYNILAYRGSPVFIDFSQTTTLRDPNAREWLVRDCKNMAKFFSKRGFEMTEEELLARVKGK